MIQGRKTGQRENVGGIEKKGKKIMNDAREKKKGGWERERKKTRGKERMKKVSREQGKEGKH